MDLEKAKEIIEAVKMTCLEEIEILEEGVEVTDGTEQLNEGRAEMSVGILRLINKVEASSKKNYGFDSPEWKKMIKANEARTEESATKNSAWAPGAIDRIEPDA